MTGFQPPPYPYDRLAPILAIAEAHPGGAVDLSIGTPTDPPPPEVVAALAESNTERGYPPSIGTPAFRGAVVDWFQRRFGVQVDSAQVAACVGTKELVVGLPHWLKLRQPELDTVLYPAVSYPSYAMGATLAGIRAVPVAVNEDFTLNLDSISSEDTSRALCLWVNTPGNPAGGLDDLAAVAAWGRENNVLILSDECYVEFTWSGDPAVADAPPGQTILSGGTDGVLSVQSLSKRSNLAGLRVGFYAGDEALVRYLSEVRKHSGLMVPGPVQEAGTVALGDQSHVRAQRDRYWNRLKRLAVILESRGLSAEMPGGGFYLWVRAPGGDSWALAESLATDLGIVGSPGEFYGESGSDFLRLAVVQSDKSFELLEQRADIHP